MNCLFCGQPFEPKRKTAKFCTKKCNTYYNRNIKVNKKDLENIDSTTDIIKKIAENKVSTTNTVVSTTPTVALTESKPIPKTLVVNKKVKKYMGAFGMCTKHQGSSYFTCGCKPKESGFNDYPLENM